MSLVGELASYSGGGPARFSCTGSHPSPGLHLLASNVTAGPRVVLPKSRIHTSGSSCHRALWTAAFPLNKECVLVLRALGKNVLTEFQSCEEIYSSKMNENRDLVETPLGPMLLGSSSFYASSLETAFKNVGFRAEYVARLVDCLSTCIQPWV